MHAPGDSEHLTDRLEGQEDAAWQSFTDGLTRLCEYLLEHHPDEYNALLQEESARQQDYDITPQTSTPGSLARAAKRALTLPPASAPVLPPNDFVRQCVATYRSVYDRAGIEAEIGKLEAEHTVLMHRYADLPTPRAKEKAKGELTELEARIEALEGQQQDMSDVIEGHYRQMTDLQAAIRAAKQAMTSANGERAIRHKAEALRGLLVEIRCEFVATGKGLSKHVGPGQARSRLSAVTFLPIAGDARRYLAVPDSGNSDITVARSAAPNAGPARNRRPAPRSQGSR
jgi:hypothetical protein